MSCDSTTQNRAGTSELRGVTDGCKCWITLSATKQLCFPNVLEPHDTLLAPNTPHKISLRIGSRPDQRNSLRSVLERSLLTLHVGSSTVIQTEETINLHLDAFTAPPAFHETPVNDEEEEKNQPTLTNKKKPETGGSKKEEEGESDGTNKIAWSASMARLWLVRAEALKSRGSDLIKATHRLPSEKDRYTRAFQCYSRALQLVTLVGTSAGLSEMADQLDGKDVPCEITIGSPVCTADYLDLDGGKSLSREPDGISLNPALIEKLNFALLSNMALCQLKVGTLAHVVSLCTRALQLAPSDNKLSDDDSGFCKTDVEKVLYRRGTAYLRLEEFEDGAADAERLLALNPTNQAAARLAELIRQSQRAHTKSMAEKMKKAFQ